MLNAEDLARLGPSGKGGQKRENPHATRSGDITCMLITDFLAKFLLITDFRGTPLTPSPILNHDIF